MLNMRNQLNSGVGSEKLAFIEKGVQKKLYLHLVNKPSNENKSGVF